MASAAKSAFGTILSLGGVPIVEIKKVGGVSLKNATIDVTNHQSPSRAMEFIAGLLDSGEISLEGNWLGAASASQGFSAGGLGYALVQGSVSTYTIDYTDSGTSTATFTAIVMAYNIDASHDSNLKLAATLKVTGPVSWS